MELPAAGASGLLPTPELAAGLPALTCPAAARQATGRTPSELLAQTRTNCSNVGWWREQLESADSDLTRAEWALALWSTASGEVVSELLPELTEVLAHLPDDRRRTVLRAAEQIARFGWLTKRPVAGDTADSDLAALNKLRALGAADDLRHGPSGPRYAAGPQPSLLSVARAAKWLKVDTEATYR